MRLLSLLVAVLVALALAIPALGADPSPSAAPPGQSRDRPGKAARGLEMQVTLTGVIAQDVDGKGRPTFSMTVDGTPWELSAGPKWYWGANNPLTAYVGKTVTVTGTHRAGDTDVDVLTVEGKAIRPAGKPPWAGGPKVVGQAHPGWKGVANGGTGRGNGEGKGHGRANAPGQLKDKAPAADDNEAGEPADAD
jgi:hypothetical protein